MIDAGGSRRRCAWASSVPLRHLTPPLIFECKTGRRPRFRRRPKHVATLAVSSPVVSFESTHAVDAGLRLRTDHLRLAFPISESSSRVPETVFWYYGGSVV